MQFLNFKLFLKRKSIAISLKIQTKNKITNLTHCFYSIDSSNHQQEHIVIIKKNKIIIF